MTLTELLGSGVGPVSVRSSGQGVTAVFDGHDVECVTEGDTVRLRLEARLLWVGQARAGELRARLAEHALSRPELLMTEVADDGSTVTITLWIDAAPMTPVTLAQAVRTVRRSLAEAEPQLTALGAAIVRDRPAGFPTRGSGGGTSTSSTTLGTTADTPYGASGDAQSGSELQHPDTSGTQQFDSGPVQQDYSAAPAVEDRMPVQGAAPVQYEQQPAVEQEPVFEQQPAVEQEPVFEQQPAVEQQPQDTQVEVESGSSSQGEALEADEPRWGYVQQATEVRGLQDTDVVVGTLVPGQWYELRTSANGWTHVVSVDGNMEGWAAAALLNERRG